MPSLDQEAFCDSTSVQLALSPLHPASNISPRVSAFADGTMSSCLLQPLLSSPHVSPAPCSSVSFSIHASPSFSSLPRRRVLSMSSMLQHKPNFQVTQTLKMETHADLSSVQKSTDYFKSPIISLSSSRSISHFDLMGTTGCGAYGKVLLGHLHENTGLDYSRKLCAIKVLRKIGMKQNETEEVKRELRTLRWIRGQENANNGPAGASFLQTMSESFQNNQFVFVILEYHPVSLENPEVASRLRLQRSATASRLSSVSLPSTLEDLHKYRSNALASLRLLAAELVLGLTFLHESGIVHQVIKPANIMVSSSGHIVISDLGASTLLPFSFDYEDFPAQFLESRAKKTFHHIVLPPHAIISLTPLYAAPEIRHSDPSGHVIYDQKVDWWSLGVTLYELATGTIPFRFLPSSGPSTRNRLWRRAVGDFSLAFGELEKITPTISSVYAGEDGSHFEGFLRALLADLQHDRLGDEDVKAHPFFGPIYNLWEEIAAMAHPPLPNPPSVVLDHNISFGMSMGLSTTPFGSASDILDVLEEQFSPDELQLDQDEAMITRATSSPTAGAKEDQSEISTASVSDVVPEKVDLCEDEFDTIDAAGCYVPDSPEDGLTSVELVPLDDAASSLQPFPSTASLCCMDLRGDCGSESEAILEEANDGQAVHVGEIDSEIDEVVFMSSLRSAQPSGRSTPWTTVDVISVDSHVPSESHLSRVEDCIFSPRPPVESLLLTSTQNHKLFAGLAPHRSCPPAISSSPPPPKASFTPRNRQTEPLRNSTNSKESRGNRWKRLSAPLSQIGYSLSQPSSKLSLPRPKRLSLIPKPASLPFSSGKKEKRRSDPVTHLFPFLPSPGHSALASPSPLSSNLSFETDEYACVRAPSRYHAQSSILPLAGRNNSVLGSPDTQSTLSPGATGYPIHQLCRVQCQTPRQRISGSDHFVGQGQDLTQSESVLFPLASPLPPRLPNPYSPSPAANADVSWRLVEDFSEPVTLEERLTIEVLNAMDTRDRNLGESTTIRDGRMSTSENRNGNYRGFSIPGDKRRSVSLGLGEVVGRNNKAKRRAVSMGVGMELHHNRRAVYGGVHEVSGFASPEPLNGRQRRRSSLLGLGLVKSSTISRKVPTVQPEVECSRNLSAGIICPSDTDDSSEEHTQPSSHRRSSILGIGWDSVKAKAGSWRASSQTQRAQTMVMLPPARNPAIGPTPSTSATWEKVDMSEGDMRKLSQPPKRAPDSSLGKIWMKLKKVSRRQSVY